MSKRNSFSPSRAAKAALGHHGFIAHTPELIASDAWRRRSIHLVRILDRLELEHLAHAGKENGFLRCTYEQLAAYGVARQYIKPAIADGVALGLIKVTHVGGYSGAGRNDPSTYQVTYLPWKFVPAIGPPQYLEPTNEWKSAAAKPPRKPRPFNGIKPNGHDPSQERKMTATKISKQRDRERERYLKTNARTVGLKTAAERWNAYQQLILGKYGGDSLDEAWKARDHVHRPLS
jgi:hypothetical protein